LELLLSTLELLLHGKKGMVYFVEKNRMDDRQATYLLFKEGVSQTEIARIFRRTVQTISKWKKEDDWDGKQAHEALATRTVQDDANELLMYQIETLKKLKNRLMEKEAEDGTPRLIGKGDIDGIRDLYNITRSKDVEWTTYVKVIRELTAFLKEQNFEFAQQSVASFDDFLNFKRNRTE
jgi:hypothetical protein